MCRPERRIRLTDTVLLSGWLFADLLLGLFVVFLAANTVGVKPQPIPTPVVHITPTPIPTTVTPTPLPRLELSFHRVTLTIDSNGLLNNSQAAINNLKSQILSQSFLQGRRVGLVITYGGATSDSQITTAQNIARKVMSVLADLGKQGRIFVGTSFYDPLYFFGNSPDTTVIDIYLFAQ